MVGRGVEGNKLKNKSSYYLFEEAIETMRQSSIKNKMWGVFHLNNCVTNLYVTAILSVNEALYMGYY